MYDPKPIDTSDVILPEELVALTENKEAFAMWQAIRDGEKPAN